jgi:hypothetical protein
MLKTILTRSSLGTPIADVISPMPYPAVFTMTEEASILGRQHTVRSLFLRELSDDAIHTIVREAAAVLIFSNSANITYSTVKGML